MHEARGPLRTQPALRVATVVRVHPFTVAYGVRGVTAALARDLAVHAGVAVQPDDLARHLASAHAKVT
jgi:hypothetical protein